MFVAKSPTEKNTWCCVSYRWQLLIIFIYHFCNLVTFLLLKMLENLKKKFINLKVTNNKHACRPNPSWTRTVAHWTYGFRCTARNRRSYFFHTAYMLLFSSWSCSLMQQCSWAAENCSGRFCHRSSKECECRLPQPRIIAYFSNISKSHTMRFLLSEITCAGDAYEKPICHIHHIPY